MRFAGPRMTYRHLDHGLWHLLDGLRSSPTLSPNLAFEDHPNV